MPNFFDPMLWLGKLSALPPPVAIATFVCGLSLLIVGLRFFRAYMLLAVGIAAWVAGSFLADVMLVRSWTIGSASAFLAMGVAWPVVGVLGIGAMGFTGGTLLGVFVDKGLELGNYWLVFPLGFFVAVVCAVLAPRFAVTILCAGTGVFLTLGTLGAVARAPDGLFSRAAYLDNPWKFVIFGTVLFVVAVIVQVILSPDPMVTGVPDFRKA